MSEYAYTNEYEPPYDYVDEVQEQRAKRHVPLNIEAEQAILGCFLMGNDRAIDEVSEFLRPEHFYEPLHGLIYEAVLAKHARGESISPVTLKDSFAWLDEDENYRELGTAYLARLSGAATTSINARDYGRTVYDLALRRGLIEVARQVEDEAFAAPVDTTPRQMVEKAETRLMEMTGDLAQMQTISILTAAQRVAQTAKDAAEGRVARGIYSGLNAFDAANGPMMPGDLVVIGGATSAGKTSLAQQILWNASHSYRALEDGKRLSGARCVAISMEMSAEQYVTRHLAQLTGFSTENIEMGRLSKDEQEALERAVTKLERLPLYIEDGRGLTVERIRSKARRHKRKHGLDLMLIDHLGFVAKAERRMNGLEAMETNVSAIKSLALELELPIILISHLNRGLWSRDDKRPQLADLHGSSAIEKDADVVCFVHREEYWLDRQKPDGSNKQEYEKWVESKADASGKAEIINAKRRRGRAAQTFFCGFDAERTTFRNLEG